MKKLICGLALALGLSLSCHAQGMKISQYPNTNNLAGTNLFLIAIVGSPGTNMNISYAQLSNLLAAAIGSGGGTNIYYFTNSLWIVTNGQYRLENAPTNEIAVWINLYSTNANPKIGTLIDLTTLDPSVITSSSVSLLVDNYMDDTNEVIDVDSLAHGGNASYGIFTAQESSGSYGSYGIGVGMGAYANSGGLYSIGVSGLARGSGTNIGGYFAVVAYPDNADVSGFFDMTPTAYDGIGLVQDAGVLVDVRSSAFPIIVGRTNNGDTVFKVDNKGMVTSHGSLYPTNSLAIPTASQLGVGGYWTGNSNGFLVTVYSLDGSTTVMKVLAP